MLKVKILKVQIRYKYFEMFSPDRRLLLILETASSGGFRELKNRLLIPSTRKPWSFGPPT